MIRRFLFAGMLLCSTAFVSDALGQNARDQAGSPSKYNIIKSTISPDKRMALAYKMTGLSKFDWAHVDSNKIRHQQDLNHEIKCVILSFKHQREVMEVETNHPWQAHGDEPTVWWSRGNSVCFYSSTRAWGASSYIVLLNHNPLTVLEKVEDIIRPKLHAYLKRSYPKFYSKYSDFNVSWPEGVRFRSSSSLDLRLHFFVPKGRSQTEAHLVARLAWSPEDRQPKVRVVSLKERSMSLDPKDRNLK
ncbi:MAG: hypothetical protein ABJA67_06445 [Chthonomonadales bacterium]